MKEYKKINHNVLLSIIGKGQLCEPLSHTSPPLFLPHRAAVASHRRELQPRGGNGRISTVELTTTTTTGMFVGCCRESGLETAHAKVANFHLLWVRCRRGRSYMFFLFLEFYSTQDAQE